MLYLSVFDDGSKYFGGYMEDLSAGILSKSLVSTLVKLVLFAALVPVVKKQVVSLYEKL